MLGGLVTQTGTPRRPKLLAIERPLRFPPITNAPVVSVMGRRPVHDKMSCGFQRLNPHSGLSDLGADWFADENAIPRSFSGNAAEKGARSVMCTDDKLHQGSETPNGWRPENVQLRHGRFEALTEPRVSLEMTYGLCQLRSKEIVFGNVHSVSGSQKNMVDGSVAAVIQPDSHALAKRRSGNDGMSEFCGHVLKPTYQPTRSGRPDRSFAQPVLRWTRETPN